MGWTRRSGRIARERRRPCLESLETRQLLSTASAKPASSSLLNSDGSTNFDQIIGASAARSEFGVDGTGQTVAVIDTGVDYNNSVLGNGIGAGDKVVAGVDFTGSKNGVLPTWQHGTGVAGLAAGNGGGYTGVAPGADIVALRVFGDNNQGSFTEIADALDWVVQNHSTYDITVVNLSIADGGNYTSNLFANSGVGQKITEAVSQLDALDIPVVVAAGNSYDGKTQGVGFPAIVPDTISVTATDASDKLASTAQRLGSDQGGASAVKIAAPGVGITAPSGNGGTTTEDGTSFATPQVSGSIVLLQQMYENAYHTLPSIAELDQLLQQGAVPVHDGATGIDVGRLDVLNSAKILNQQIASQANTGTKGGTTTSTAVTHSDETPNSTAGAITGTTTSTGTAITGTTTSTGTTITGTTTSTGTTITGTTTSTGSAITGATTSTGTTSTDTTAPINSVSTGTSTADTSVSTGSTSTTSPPASTTPAPSTQVFVNGVSIGDYSTSQLAAKYPGLFAFLQGPVTSLRIWSPAGSQVNLGQAASPAPASASVSVHPSLKYPTSIKAEAQKAHATSVGKVVPVVNHPAVHKKSNSISSFFSSLFHF